MNTEAIEKLTGMLLEAVPQGLSSARDELETNFRATLSAGLSRLDLVTREEFEVQEAVLARTREKLEQLEARLAAIESPAEGDAGQPETD